MQVVLLLLLFPLMLSAQTYESPDKTYSLNYTVSGTDATITGGTFRETFGGTLDIPATITVGAATYRVTAIGNGAFMGKAAVTSLTLHENLQTIGYRAFKQTGIGGKLVFPSTVKSVDYRAFELTKITEAEFPASSKLTTLGDNVFAGSLLARLVLPASLTAIPKDAFPDLPTLKSVTLPPGLVSMGESAFKNTGLTGVIELPATVTSLGKSCFMGTTSLEAVNFVPDSPVTAIPDDAFRQSGIKRISLPANLQTIGNNAFRECKNVESPEIVLPASLVSIGEGAFAHWRKESTVPVFPGKNKLVFPKDSKLTTIGIDAFRNGNWYGDITLPNSLTKISDRAFLRNEQWDGHITLPETLTEIGAYAFELVGSTQSLVIPAGVTTIGDGAFFCSPFSGISFADGSQLEKIGASAFKQCFNLSYLDLSNITKLKATDASRMPSATGQYAEMPNYTMVYLPAGSTVKDGEENFVADGHCSKFVVYDSDKEGRYYSIGDKKYGDRTWVGQSRRVMPDAPTPENFNMSRGCDYTILHGFTAATASYVNRTFAKEYDRTYTVTLPFDARVPAGMRAYQLKRLLAESNRYYFVWIGNDQMKANEPYVLRVVDASQSLTFPVSNEAEVKKAPAESTQTSWQAEDGLKFLGTTFNVFHHDAAGKGWYTLKNGTWYPVIRKGGTSWNGTDTDEDAQNGYKGFVHSMRAYVVRPAAEGKAPVGFVMLIDDESEVAGIEDVEKNIQNQQEKIYTTDGRCVGTDFNSLPAGEIYIVGGKKIYKI